jgi:hypothetical protein
VLPLPGQRVLTVAIHQPVYLPWLGLLDKIARCDVFVLLDTVQFEKGDVSNRNWIKTQAGPQRLTIPVIDNHLNETLLETRMDDKQPWRRKHLRAIELAYSRAPRFYADPTDRLTEFCVPQLAWLQSEFGITTRVVRSSELGARGHQSTLLARICSEIGADVYLSGAFARCYLDETEFEERGIDVVYQDFRHPTYPQLHGEFVPRMCALDALMNTRLRMALVASDFA